MRIHESSSLEILGVLLDTKLTFEEHLSRVAARVSGKIGLLRRVNSVFEDAAVAMRCFFHICAAGTAVLLAGLGICGGL